MLCELNLEFVHRPYTKHKNIDFSSQMAKEMEVVLKYDNFFDEILMLVDIVNDLEEYEDIIRYLEDMNFSVGVTKQRKRRITHKSCSYTLIGVMF